MADLIKDVSPSPELATRASKALTRLMATCDELTEMADALQSECHSLTLKLVFWRTFGVVFVLVSFVLWTHHAALPHAQVTEEPPGHPTFCDTTSE